MTAPNARTVARGEAIPPVLGPFARYSPYAWMLPQELWGRPKQEAMYTIEFITPVQLVAAGGAPNPRTLTVGIERGAAFAVIEMMATVYNVDNTTLVPLPSIMVQVRDVGSKLDFFDVPVHFLSCFNVGQGGGNSGGYTRQFALPKIVDPGGTIAVQLENFDAVARHVRVTFHGFRVWL